MPSAISISRSLISCTNDLDTSARFITFVLISPARLRH